MKSYDIVGWTFDADTYHPECMPEYWRGSLKGGDPNDHIKARVWRHGIDELKLETSDPRWEDSGTLPQVIFVDQCTEETCGKCHESLLEV